MFSQRKHHLSIMSTDFQYPKHIDMSRYQKALTIFQGPAFLGLAYKFISEVRREREEWVFMCGDMGMAIGRTLAFQSINEKSVSCDRKMNMGLNKAR